VFFFGAVQSQAKWLVRPQLKQTVPEAALAVGGIGRCNAGFGGGRALGVACWCEHGCGWEAHYSPSNVDANVNAVGLRGEKDAPPSTLAEHYRMGLS
jgi:hypothetical protein